VPAVKKLLFCGIVRFEGFAKVLLTTTLGANPKLAAIDKQAFRRTKLDLRQRPLHTHLRLVAFGMSWLEEDGRVWDGNPKKAAVYSVCYASGLYPAALERKRYKSSCTVFKWSPGFSGRGKMLFNVNFCAMPHNVAVQVRDKLGAKNSGGQVNGNIAGNRTQ
jgi:hypothetical protein